MSQIYQNVTQVIIYVGPCAGLDEPTSVLSKGTELMKRLYKHFEPNYEKLSQFDSTAKMMSS